MTRIMRAGGVKLSSDIVKIGDASANLKPKPRAVVHSTTKDNAVFIGAELPEHMTAAKPEPQDVVVETESGENSEADTAVQLSNGVKEEIIQSAMEQAGRILEDAVMKAQKMRDDHMASAQAEAKVLHRKAEEEGRDEGLRKGLGEVAKITDDIEAAIARFEGGRAGFEAEYEGQLKWLAMEIASKVLAKKVHEDDAEMSEMVQKAVQSVKSEPWIRVEVAQDMTRLIDSLSAIYAGNENVEVSAVPLAAGSVQIETPSGVVDASLSTQLANLRQYFAKTNA